jgi:hypothetical protein
VLRIRRWVRRTLHKSGRFSRASFVKQRYASHKIIASAEVLLNASKNANAVVLWKWMQALIYEDTSLFVRACGYGAALLQDHLFAVLAFAKQLCW